MTGLKSGWMRLMASFDAKVPRERMLISLALIGGVLLVGGSVFVDPVLQRARQAKGGAAQSDAELATVLSQTDVVRRQLETDPDAERKLDIERLNARLKELEQNLQALEDRFVPPEQMSNLLDSLLANNVRLRLLSLKSLAPVNLADVAQGKISEKSADKLPQPTNPLGLYKHGVELRLEGSYPDLYAWLAQLEHSQKKILWGDVRLSVVEHPRAVMTLIVYTLSTDKAWLSI